MKHNQVANLGEMTQVVQATQAKFAPTEYADALVISCGKDLGLLRDCATHLTPKDFHKVSQRIVYAGLVSCFQDRPEMPTIMELGTRITEVCTRMTAALDSMTKQEICNIMESIADPNVVPATQYLRDGLQEYLGEKRMTRAVAEHQEVLNTEGGYTEFMNKMNEEFKKVMAVQERKVMRKGRAARGIIMCDEERPVFIPTGIRALDYKMGGGHLIGDIGLITAAPGVGKTNTLIHFAAVANVPDCRSLVISCELQSRLLEVRHTAMISSIPAMRLKEAYPNWEQVDQLKFAMIDDELFPEFATTTFIDLSDRKYSYMEIEAVIEQWKEDIIAEEGFLPEKLLVALDWIDMLLPKSVGPNVDKWMVVPELLYEFKYMAKRQGFAGWTATQANKEAMKTSVLGMDNVSGGFHKNDALDIGIGVGEDGDSRLTEEAFEEGSAPDDGSKAFVLTLNKNRHGETGSMSAYRAPTLRLFDDEDSYLRMNSFIEKIVEGVYDRSMFSKAVRSNGQTYHINKLEDKHAQQQQASQDS